jgi:hypothetical protein
MSDEIDFFSMAQTLSCPNNPSKSDKKTSDTQENPTNSEQNPKNSAQMDVEKAKKALQTPLMLELQTKAEHFIVETPGDANDALSMRDQAWTFAKQIESTRKEIVRPHLDFQKAVKQFADDLKGQFEQIAATVEQKMNDYLDGKQLPQKLENEDAAMKEVAETTFEVEDETLIPREFLKVDEKAIKAALKDGVRSIPGIKIVTEKKRKYRSKPKKKA